MKYAAALFVAALVAFGAGFGTARLTPPAAAASEAATAQVIDLGALTFGDLPAPSPGAPLHAKELLLQDGARVGIQIGVAAKHYHAQATEVQYVIDGSGTEWLGDQQVALKPGILLIIPNGTAHGGSTETSGHLKMLTVHTPPLVPGETHLLQ